MRLGTGWGCRTQYVLEVYEFRLVLTYSCAQFNNGCSSPGDGVDDTPAQRVPTNGCPTSRPDTCTGGGPDLVDNIMDYGACRDKFTQGQMLKMTNDWFRYRS